MLSNTFLPFPYTYIGDSEPRAAKVEKKLQQKPSKCEGAEQVPAEAKKKNEQDQGKHRDAEQRTVEQATPGE